jgi:hypothetical protein
MQRRGCSTCNLAERTGRADVSMDAALEPVTRLFRRHVRRAKRNPGHGPRETEAPEEARRSLSTIGTSSATKRRHVKRTGIRAGRARPEELRVIATSLRVVDCAAGLGVIPMIAVWVLGYVGPLYTGLETIALDGRANPRAQKRAADDLSHWYAEDGCGRWDLKAFGPEVVAQRRAWRRALEDDPDLRRWTEARRARRSAFMKLSVLCTCACGLSLCALAQSTGWSPWREHQSVCSALCFLAAAHPGALLASITMGAAEHVRGVLRILRP